MVGWWLIGASATGVGWVCVVGSGVIGWGPVGLLGVWCSGRGPADHGADAGADWLRLVLFRFGFLSFGFSRSRSGGGGNNCQIPVLTKGKYCRQFSDVRVVARRARAGPRR